jgi:hypothetical protein
LSVIKRALNLSEQYARARCLQRFRVYKMGALHPSNTRARGFERVAKIQHPDGEQYACAWRLQRRGGMICPTDQARREGWIFRGIRLYPKGIYFLYFNGLRERNGAPGPTRTDTPAKAADFESAASTNSATGAGVGWRPSIAEASDLVNHPCCTTAQTGGSTSPQTRPMKGSHPPVQVHSRHARDHCRHRTRPAQPSGAD